MALREMDLFHSKTLIQRQQKASDNVLQANFKACEATIASSLVNALTEHLGHMY